jgi:hypothetical protein
MDRRKRLRAPACIFALATMGVLACKKSPDGTASATPTQAVDCAAVREQVEPELMAWDSPSRTQLDRLRRQGVVAVRYETHGCEVSLELLPQCIGPKNKYVYVPFNASDTKIAHDANELFAQLPVGAANLSGLLKDRRALRTDFKLVGSIGLPEGSTIGEYDLVGPECRRATHIISAVFVGGFSMASAAASQVNGAGNLFSRGDTMAGGEAVAREGHPAICERAEAEGVELGGCSVPLRVSLIALGQPARAPTCPKTQAWDGHRCAPTRHPDVAAAGTRGDEASTPSDGGAARPFDQNAIERVTRQHQGAIRRTCWEATTESMKRVTVTVSARVDVQGRVVSTDAQVLDSDGPADVATVVARCIATEIRGWQFPEPDSEKVLTLPFHLIRQ